MQDERGTRKLKFMDEVGALVTEPQIDCILHYLVERRFPYDASVFAQEEERRRKVAALFGFQQSAT
jgi:hypothetical protein